MTLFSNTISNSRKQTFFSFLLAGLVFLFVLPPANAIIRPLPLTYRVAGAKHIALVTPETEETYMDDNGNIYTLYTCKVKAYLKGDRQDQRLAVIAQGGTYGDRIDVVYPSFSMQTGNDYLVLLNGDNTRIDHKEKRNTHPGLLQATPYTYVQGVFSKQAGKFYDIATEPPRDEQSLLNKILGQLNKRFAVKPDGTSYLPQETTDNIIGWRAAPSITSIEDGTGGSSSFVSGTIITNNELIIKGSNFGANRGNGYVAFSNADDGGSSYVITSIASDYLSWSDTEIRVKIIPKAGTGIVLVHNDAGENGTHAITIDWGVKPVYDDFYNFSETTRQRVELCDKNGSGGLTYVFNTNFFSNNDAIAAFERALSTWRCGVGVNFDRDTTAAVADGFASDDKNVVLFADLPGGTLGVATSRYKASGSPSCDQFNTYWRLKEVDIRFDSTGTNWQFGPDDPASNQSDFESVALHELGHAVGLTHIINQGHLMHYSITTGTTNRTLDNSATNAGNHKMSHSTQMHCIHTPPPMTAVAQASCNLPAELVTFMAEHYPDAVKLRWSTASEENNDFFIVERSRDGKHFAILRKVMGAGNSVIKQDYEILDKSPFLGTNYYRLKQVDFDNHITLSRIIAIKFTGKETIQVVPNPVNGNHITLQYLSGKNALLTVIIHDLQGKTVFTNEYPVVKDINSMEIDVSPLPAGIYVLEAIRDNTATQIKFVRR